MGCSYVNKIQRQIVFTASCVYRVDFLSRTPALSSVFVMSRLVISAFSCKSSSRMRIVSTVTLNNMFVSGCPTGSDLITTVFQSFRLTNQQFCLASCPQVELVWHVCLAALVPGFVHRWWVIFLLYVCIWKGLFFCTMLLVTGLIRWEFVYGLMRLVNRF